MFKIYHPINCCLMGALSLSCNICFLQVVQVVGKSVMLIFLVLQMINKTIPYCLYFADAKGSAHALLGKMLAPERTAIEITDIAALLKEFVERMHDRQRTMEKLLQGNITGDYTDFSLKPFVFLFEEFGAVVKGQSKEDKKAVEEIKQSSAAWLFFKAGS